MALDRRIWMNPDDVPADVYALGVKIAVSDKPGGLMSGEIVFVEIDASEWGVIGRDVRRISAKARELGQWVASQLGGYVKQWHE